jgi:hypothetical protein
VSYRFESLGLLPKPPYRLDPEYLERHRKTAWLQLLGAVVCTVIGVWYLGVQDRGLTDHQRDKIGFVYLAVAVGLYVLAWRSLRLLQVARTVGTTGVEALCRVVDVTARKTRLRTVMARDYTLELRSTSGDAPRVVKVPFPAKAEPLHLPGDNVLALVVEELPRHPLLLHRNLWPLQLRDDEVRQIAERLQKADPDSQWQAMPTSKGLRLLAQQGRRKSLGGAQWRAERS